MKERTEREQWFIDRIGKRIFRNATTCSCSICADVAKNGIIVHDEYHAIYLCDTEADYAADDFELNYRDIL